MIYKNYKCHCGERAAEMHSTGIKDDRFKFEYFCSKHAREMNIKYKLWEQEAFVKTTNEHGIPYLRLVEGAQSFFDYLADQVPTETRFEQITLW